jgi:hypothetical protein
MERKNYNVFIGWSGERSRLVATFLRGWISQVVQSARPWMSDTDIQKGSRWLDEASKVLADIRVGITCLTPENLQRPWILFEAGAISKAIGERTRLCTFLIGEIEPQDIEPPLGMFQATKAQKEDTLKLIRTINAAVSEEPVPEKDLDEVFAAMWPKFERMLETLPAPEETAPAKRPVEDMVAEILEIVRTDSNRGSILSGVSTTLSGISATAGIGELKVPNPGSGAPTG